jgi:hypothetical protein
MSSSCNTHYPFSSVRQLLPFFRFRHFLQNSVLKHLQLVNMTAFWDIAPSNLVGVDRRFRGAYCLHHQGYDYHPDDGGSMHIWNVGILATLHGAISQEALIFTFVAVRTWNLTPSISVFHWTERLSFTKIQTNKQVIMGDFWMLCELG